MTAEYPPKVLNARAYDVTVESLKPWWPSTYRTQNE
jgi:hypothetical protein